jgi:hypothetical protein
MRFLMILVDVETEQLRPGDPGFAERMAGYATFTKKTETLGAFRAAGKLQPTKTARTVRIRDGKTLVTEGPFAETREQVGGFYLLECKDLDEALELAAQIPTAAHGSVEVRPLF